jgi:hypothetical protein
VQPARRLEVVAVVQAEQSVLRSAAVFAASTQPQFTTQGFDIWQVARAYRLRGAHAVFDDGVLTVQYVDELGVAAAGHAADPAGGRDLCR